jgi:hypothetical protein
VNASLLAVLDDAERLLVAETERDRLATLDEDAAIELEAQIRRARNKHVSQYRRGASAAVADKGGRGKAWPQNTRAPSAHPGLRNSARAPLPWVPAARPSVIAGSHRPAITG